LVELRNYELMESSVSKSVHQLLAQIPDPEIPVISIVDLGIVRNVEIHSDSAITVTITPTYSGCPAMRLIEDEIKSVLKKEGFKEVHIKTTLTPAWTTDWLSETAKQKLVD
jgi:ring-1,2-phenylacetyl-CoA epoxidase subunit PaaD